MDKEELSILKKAKAGDQVSLAALIVKYDPAMNKIASFFQNRFKNTYSLDFLELKQDALIAFLKSVSRYDNDKNKSFLNYSKICMLNALTSTIRRKRTETPSPTIPIEPGEDNPGINVVSLRPSPQETLENEKIAEEIRATLKKLLSESQYCVMELYFNGFSYLEIASLLHISKKAVDNTIAGAKIKISKNKELFAPIIDMSK